MRIGYRSAVLAEDETSMTAANDLLVRRALWAAGYGPLADQKQLSVRAKAEVAEQVINLAQAAFAATR